jgi:hypothetical protein
MRDAREKIAEKLKMVHALHKKHTVKNDESDDDEVTI